ncbi:MAG: ABC transporter ATP-binding protein, partial [Acetobacteraceae bacterium]
MSAAGAGAVTVAVRRKRFATAGGPGGERAAAVLERIEFAVGGGEFCVLLGPSGCGKTTLLNIIAGLDRDFEGEVRIPGAVAGRARAGCVFQTPRLLPWLTVADNLRLVLPPEADERAALALLEAMELGPVRDLYPNRLSGGMQRRVALARAFAIRPPLLLLDEPFVSLDGPTADRLRGLLVDLWRWER